MTTVDYERRIKERLRILGRPTTEKDVIKQLRVKGEARLEAKRVDRSPRSRRENWSAPAPTASAYPRRWISLPEGSR